MRWPILFLGQLARIQEGGNARHRISFRERRQDQLHDEPTGIPVGPEFIRPDVGCGLVINTSSMPETAMDLSGCAPRVRFLLQDFLIEPR
jgi:hypothetical protein